MSHPVPPETPAAPAPAADPAPQPAAPDPAPAPTAQAPPADPAPGAQDPAPAGTPAAQQPAEPAAGSIDELPPWAQKLVRDTRSEAAANRTKAKEHESALTTLQAKSQEQLDGIARALGLKPEEATPEQIMAERDTARATAAVNAAAKRASDVELAVFRAAARAGADGDKLLDSRTFVTGLADMDPAADGFAQQVSDRIAAALDSNPGWKLAEPVPAGQPAAPPLAPAAPLVPQVPASSPQPGSFGQPPAGPRQLTAEDAKGMSAQAVQKAINEGLFTEAGFGPARSYRR
jgi:hypothetical protein